MSTTISRCCRAFITWLANGDAIRVFKMIKKEDGTFSFKAAPEDFPQKHRAPVLNIGIAETGTEIQTAFSNHHSIFYHILKNSEMFPTPCLIFLGQESSS